MASKKIDEWVKKNPESWSKLANNLKNFETFANFKKKFKQGAKNNGKDKQIDNMTNNQLKQIWVASGTAPKPNKIKLINPEEKLFKPKKIKIKRNGKTYEKTVTTRWSKNTQLALQITSKLNPRTKEYNENIQKLVESTGRSKQAVKKKVYRTKKN